MKHLLEIKYTETHLVEVEAETPAEALDILDQDPLLGDHHSYCMKYDGEDIAGLPGIINNKSTAGFDINITS